VNYSLRYTAMTDALSRFIESGEIGEVLGTSYERSRASGLHVNGARHRAIEEPEESGGWIVHHACHQLDLLYFLLGEFDTVHCQTRTTLTEKDSEELVFANGRMKSGAMYHLADGVARVPYSHFVVIGTRASFASQRVGDHTFTRLRKESCAADDVMSFEGGWVLSVEKPHRAIEHFLDCIEGKAEPVADLRTSLESLRVAVAMKESARSGQPVRMDEFAG
jgi:predicted dehydrogenase